MATEKKKNSAQAVTGPAGAADAETERKKNAFAADKQTGSAAQRTTSAKKTANGTEKGGATSKKSTTKKAALVGRTATAKPAGSAGGKSATAKTSAAKASTTKVTTAKTATGKKQTAKPAEAKKAAAPAKKESAKSAGHAAGTKAAKPATQAAKPKKSATTGAEKAPAVKITDLTLAPPTPQEEPTPKEKPTRTAPTVDASLPVPAPETAPVEEQSLPAVDFPEAVKAEKKSFMGRVLFLLALVCLLLASYYIFLHRPASYIGRANAVTFMEAADGATVIAVNGAVRERVSGPVHDVQHDVHGMVCIALIGNDLYLIKNRSVAKMAEGVRDFLLAGSGNAVAYRDSANNLYHVMLGQKEPPVKFSQVHDGRYCLSPNGKELAYTWVHNGTPRMRVYSTSGHEVEIGEDGGRFPLGVSNKATYLYYTDEAGALYLLQRGNAPVKLANAFLPTSLCFNERFDEALFATDAGTAWVRRGQMSALHLNGNGAGMTLTPVPNHMAEVAALRTGVCLPVRTFAGSYFLAADAGGSTLAYLKGGKKDPGNLTPVSRVLPESVTVTDKAAYFLLEREGGEGARTDLYRAAAGRAKAKVLLRDVVAYCPNVDGSRLLYVMDDHALYSVRVGLLRTVSKRLCDAADSAPRLTVTADDVFYFFRADGKLCRSDNGDAALEVADGVEALVVDGHTVCFAVREEGGHWRVFANYRNRRRDTKIAEGILSFAP